jgi:hypothetical protein
MASDCVEVLGGTTDICLENRYLPMCFNMAGCVAPVFFIIQAETVCFLFVGTESKRRSAAPHHSVPRRTVTVVAEPHEKLLVRPRLVGDFVLADPISRVCCDLGRPSQRSVVALTGVCTQCQLVREVSPAQVTESLVALCALRQPSQSFWASQLV